MEVSAQVIAIDKTTRTVTLNVQNPEHFKVVKVGDQAEANYTEALALSVEPAPKPAAAMQK